MRLSVKGNMSTSYFGTIQNNMPVAQNHTEEEHGDGKEILAQVSFIPSLISTLRARLLTDERPLTTLPKAQIIGRGSQLTLGLDAVASSLIHTSPIIAYRVNLNVCRLLRPDVPTQEEVTQRSSYIPDPALILVCLETKCLQEILHTRATEAFRPASIMRMSASHESSVNPRSFAQPPHVEAISMPTNLINQLHSFQTVPSAPIITRGNPNLQSESGRWIPFFVRPSNSTSVTSSTKPPVPELTGLERPCANQAGPARTTQPPGPAVLRHAFYFRLAVVNPPAAEPATNYCAAAVCSGDSNYYQQRVAAKAACHQRTAKTLTTPLSQAAEMPPASPKSALLDLSDPHPTPADEINLSPPSPDPTPPRLSAGSACLIEHARGPLPG
ncbi:uncharacterized protein CLUP02_16851 [Colletotrichum lupini]|uniref:Uncharacterized protein n=1 Tax=Colletotrichum lupini TaxID=145971 RepID=A0A9Q8T8W6_9PEZI|nr:uncharacterized protein CLUP02_16851 [Colletotrichum lupini]UQC91317.1 hypothetical protein CLUP02_16851 [Colletotrichum lupini]